MAEEDKNSIKFRRNYKACLNCRTRKVRCDLGPVEAPHDPPCARCRRERKECVFAESRRGGSHGGSAGDGIVKKRKLEATPEVVQSGHSTRQNSTDQHHRPSLQSLTQAVNYTQQQEQQQQQQQQQIHHPQAHHPIRPPSGSAPAQTQPTVQPTHSPEEHSQPVPPPTRPSEITTLQGALVFLARAAGTIAKADDRDNINGREIHEKLEDQDSSTSTSRNNSNTNITTTSSTINAPEYENSFIAPLIRPHGKKPTVMPPVSNASNVRPNPSKRLTDIEYIGPNKMLTEQEAERLINLFFLTMHPFFPHIPTQLHAPQILAQYPILLCAILTISSRYHPFENTSSAQVNKNSRNIQLHERLWIYCQRLISQTVWAEASTRSIGTVLAFLLFTEWNPRAIHWRWSDYANNKDDMGPEGPGLPNDEEEDEGLAGLGAMRRSDRMAWMLVGTSVRLAQDMGFINSSSKIFIATHIAETHTAMNLGQRSMLAQSLGEIDLHNDDDDEDSGSAGLDSKRQYQHDEFILSLDEEILRNRHFKKNNLKFSSMQKAKLELLKIMSLAYETIYCGKYQLDGYNNLQNLTVLSILSPLIENWYKTYKKFLKPSNPKNFNHHCNLRNATNIKHVNEITKQVDKESLICDYYYCQLYIYSLALSMDNPLNTNLADSKKPLNNLKLDEISKAAKYVELAYNAAKEILTAAIRVHKLKMLKYMPVRWVTRIVRSVAFIVKCFLTLTNNNNNSDLSNVLNSQASTILTLSIIPTEEIIQTIQKAAIVLREASPDELHLCTRYSTILMYLCSEMKYRSKLSINPPNLTKLSTSDDEDEEIEQQQNAAAPSQQDDDSAVPLNEEHYQQQTNTTTPMYNFGYQTMGGGNTSNNNMDPLQPLPDAVVDWFLKNDESIGLDFVEPWTEMIEQHLDKKKS